MLALPVIKVVTAFTVAHSITLSLAALQIVVISSAVVEPAIAASIVYVAMENFFSRNVDSRWRDTFAFGLIHGFGFASALQEFGLLRGAVVPALASFNIGIEVGQVAIVSLVIPLLIGLDWVIAATRDAPLKRTTALVYTVSGFIAIQSLSPVSNRMLPLGCLIRKKATGILGLWHQDRCAAGEGAHRDRRRFRAAGGGRSFVSGCADQVFDRHIGPNRT